MPVITTAGQGGGAGAARMQFPMETKYGTNLEALPVPVDSRCSSNATACSTMCCVNWLQYRLDPLRVRKYFLISGCLIKDSKPAKKASWLLCLAPKSFRRSLIEYIAKVWHCHVQVR